MSHVASFLYFNALFESSFLRAEHLTASEKYKFSRHLNSLPKPFIDMARVFTVFVSVANKNASGASKRKLGKQGFALRHKMQSEVSCGFTVFNEVLELAEIVAVLRTAYRVFFENSQMFGAERWNAWKFVVSKRRNAGTSRNVFTAIDRVLEPAEIVAVRCAAYVANQRFAYRVFACSQSLFASQETAAEDGEKNRIGD